MLTAMVISPHADDAAAFARLSSNGFRPARTVLLADGPALSGEARTAFLKGLAHERMARVTALCDALARPWTYYHSAPDVHPGGPVAVRISDDKRHPGHGARRAVDCDKSVILSAAARMYLTRDELFATATLSSDQHTAVVGRSGIYQSANVLNDCRVTEQSMSPVVKTPACCTEAKVFP